MSNCTRQAVVYSKPGCGQCVQAKNILQLSDVCFEEKIVGQDLSIEELFEVVGHPVRSVPQIFLDGRLINTLADLKKELAQ